MSDPVIEMGQDVLAKFPVCGLCRDCSDYEICAGLQPRCVTAIFHHQGDEIKISGPRKLLPFLRDAVEALLECYSDLTQGNPVVFPPGQAHMVKVLRNPAAYHDNGEVIVDKEMQEKMRTLVKPEDIVIIHDFVKTILGCPMTEYAKKVLVVDVANRFSIPLEDYVKAELLTNAEQFELGMNECIMKNLTEAAVKRVSFDKENVEDDADSFVMAEKNETDTVESCIRTPSSKSTSSSSKTQSAAAPGKKQYVPRH